MERCISLAALDEAMIREPHDIYAVDPRVPDFRKEIDRIIILADVVADGQPVQPRSAPSELLVEMDSSDPRQLRQLQEMVARVRATTE